MPDEFHVYEAMDRPDVEVLFEGVWCPGEARMRTRKADGSLVYQVQYRRPGSLSSHIDDFVEPNIREDTVDRSFGREPGPFV